jgi:hypothetical protein
MNTYVTMGLFSFVVALISLIRLLSDREFFRVRLMKRAFGRKAGLALHFTANVAAPLIVGLVFFCGGLSARSAIPSLIVENPLPDHYQIMAPMHENDWSNEPFAFIS